MACVIILRFKDLICVGWPILAVLYKHRSVADDLLYILTAKECVAVAAVSGCLSVARASNKHKKTGTTRTARTLRCPRVKQRGETKKGTYFTFVPMTRKSIVTENRQPEFCTLLTQLRPHFSKFCHILSGGDNLFS